jgi:phosphatidylserine/phosphatidylglycerophosphate/cardiolipin synthase-like enzyme
VRDLVAFASTLRQVLGTSEDTVSWIDDLRVNGLAAFGRLGARGDRVLVLQDEARRLGVLTESRANGVRLAQLVLVLDLLEAVPPGHVVPTPTAPLVFTVPSAVHDMIAPARRLDLLVEDVIARAEHTLHIGGPFWNEGGWDTMRRVVLPALEHRGVQVTYYLHPHESGKLTAVSHMLDESASHGSTQALWWNGGYPSLMHAKFVVADRGPGYFGSANLTSLGLGEHLEMGVALVPEQSSSLVDLLEALQAAGLFTSTRPGVPTG